MIESILSYLWQSLSAALLQILILCGPGFFLTLILNFETGFIQKRAVAAMGQGWYLGLFGWLGTIVHELGHAACCVIFWHKIDEMQLFHPDPETGTLGYVKHSYNRTNLYQLAGNFFIGIGPILLGTAVIFLLAYWLLDLNFLSAGSSFISTSAQLDSWEALKELLQNLWNSSSQLLVDIFSWQHLSGWQLYLFIYLVFAIGSSITLSPPDIKAALGGFGVIVLLIFVLNLATIWAGSYLTDAVVAFSGYYVLFYTVVFLIILVNVAAALFILLPLALLKIKSSK